MPVSARKSRERKRKREEGLSDVTPTRLTIGHSSMHRYRRVRCNSIHVEVAIVCAEEIRRRIGEDTTSGSSFLPGRRAQCTERPDRGPRARNLHDYDIHARADIRRHISACICVVYIRDSRKL